MKSIRWRLVTWLVSGLVLLAGLAGYALYHTARKEAAELFDYELRTVAISLPASLDDAASEGPGAAELGDLSEDRLVIQRWGDDGVPQYRAKAALQMPRLPAGFHEQAWDETHWRVFGMHLPGRFVQVAQPVSVRDALAVKMALRIVAPLWLMVPVIVVFVLWVVSLGLRPIAAISRSVAQRSYDSLAPLHFDQTIPSEIALLVDSLNDMLARLDHAVGAQRTFVANAAHELRSPLAALKLQVQLAARQGTLGADTQLANKLEERLNRIIHLVQQLLALARADADAADVDLVVDLRAIAERAVADYSLQAEVQGIDLGLDARPEPMLVHADATGIAMLLSNLIDNALRHTPGGGAVDVRLVSDGSNVSMAVIDGGNGIPEAEMAKVTDRFYRGSTAIAQGSGLGLSIVARIVERHRAHLRMHNRTDCRGLIVEIAGLRAASASAPPDNH